VIIEEVRFELETIRFVLRDRWSPGEWLEHICFEISRAEAYVGSDWNLAWPRDAYRRRLVYIAACALRALEQLDGSDEHR
jgi:hypothetical protein